MIKSATSKIIKSSGRATDTAPPRDCPERGAAETALTRVYRSYSRELIGYLRKAFGEGPPDPEDMAQAAFQKLAEQDLSGIRNLKAFLWRTARNMTLTERRNTDIRSRFDFEIEHLFFAVQGTDSDPERVLEVQQQLRLIDKALNRMPEKRKKAFLLHRVDGLNFAAVGRRLGVSRRAAVKHVARAVANIEDALSEGGERTY